MHSNTTMAASGRVGGPAALDGRLFPGRLSVARTRVVGDRDCCFRPVADRVAHDADAHVTPASLLDAAAGRCLAEVSTVQPWRSHVDDQATRPTVNGHVAHAAR